jgi:Xaa-Pro aminopeptidase
MSAGAPNRPDVGDVSSREVDTVVPRALQQFMVQGWTEPMRLPVTAASNPANKVRRRQSVSSAFPGRAVIVPNGREKIRSNDTHYRFRPSSDFLYLVGDGEPGDVLVLEPLEVGGHSECLYTEPLPEWTDANVVADRTRGALWARPHLGLEGAATRYGLTTAAIDDLATVLRRYPAPVVLRGRDAAVDATAPTENAESHRLEEVLGQLRLIKDDWEISEIGLACRLTHDAFHSVLSRLPTLRTERDVENAFDSYARGIGEGTGYPTIVASGANATIRHYTRNLSPLRDGELLLLDGGVETKEFYTADVTRTIPVNGHFSREQAALYEVVYTAHAAAMKQVKPGAPFRAPHDAAMLALCTGLFELGVMTVDPEEAVSQSQQLYRRYCRHGTSHMLGIDVHDCASAPDAAYKDGRLAVGMVLTIEPGAYLQPHDLTVPASMRGIGIRIEDDVLVTSDGCVNLSAEIPTERSAVEAWIRHASAARE